MAEPVLEPTDRELEILKVLWDRGEATVREVYEEMRQHSPIVQNTVQAFLRTMEDKGLVRHREEGRSFVYRAVNLRQTTSRTMVSGLLDRLFDGAVDQLVQSALSLKQPTREELDRLEAVLAECRRGGRSSGKGGGPRA
jgi:predicted transcriptional regulator